MRRGAFRRARANGRSSESDGGAALARRASVAVVVVRLVLGPGLAPRGSRRGTTVAQVARRAGGRARPCTPPSKGASGGAGRGASAGPARNAGVPSRRGLAGARRRARLALLDGLAGASLLARRPGLRAALPPARPHCSAPLPCSTPPPCFAFRGFAAAWAACCCLGGGAAAGAASPLLGRVRCWALRLCFWCRCGLAAACELCCGGSPAACAAAPAASAAFVQLAQLFCCLSGAVAARHRRVCSIAAARHRGLCSIAAARHRSVCSIAAVRHRRVCSISFAASPRVQLRSCASSPPVQHRSCAASPRVQLRSCAPGVARLRWWPERGTRCVGGAASAAGAVSLLRPRRQLAGESMTTACGGGEPERVCDGHLRAGRSVRARRLASRPCTGGERFDATPCGHAGEARVRPASCLPGGGTRSSSARGRAPALGPRGSAGCSATPLCCHRGSAAPCVSEVCMCVASCCSAPRSPPDSPLPLATAPLSVASSETVEM